MHTNTIDLSGSANVHHPFADYTLTDAVRLANNHRSLNLLPPVKTLSETREVIKEMATRASFTWITGMVALDVLDAAIEGRDLHVSCRLI